MKYKQCSFYELNIYVSPSEGQGGSPNHMPACAVNKIHHTFPSWFASCVVCLQRRLRLNVYVGGEQSENDRWKVTVSTRRKVKQWELDRNHINPIRFFIADSFPQQPKSTSFLFCPLENVSEYRKGFASNTCMEQKSTNSYPHFCEVSLAGSIRSNSTS